MDDRIEVIGTGTAEVRPDRMVARLGAEAMAADVAAALAEASDAVRAMAAAARARGCTDADLRSEQMSVAQNHDHRGRPEGYRVWLGLTVVLRDIDTAGSVLGDVVAAGRDAARILETSFGVTDSSAAVAAARESAVADARAQAAHLAALAGRSVGAVRRLSTVAGPEHPVPIALAATGRHLAGGVPVEGGESTVTVSVRARFDLA